MTELRAESRVFAELAGDLAAQGVSFRFQAKGRSMLPIIADGDILYVEPVQPAQIKVGEIVLFRDSEEFKAHRVIRKSGSVFCTRGDAMIHEDDLITGDSIYGRIVARESATGDIAMLCGFWPRLKFFSLVLRCRLHRLNQFAA